MPKSAVPKPVAPKRADPEPTAGAEAADAPKRQARGQRRIEQILHAAARVFAAEGYEGATTNAIAAEAGISPGSLYQFFGNKEQIAAALANEYAARLAAMRQSTFDDVDASSIEAVVHRVVAPLVEFNLAHPGFKALFARTDMPARLGEAVAPVHAAVQARVASLIATLIPGLDAAELERTALVSTQIVRGVMPLVVAAAPAERARLTAELETSLTSYLTAVSGR